MQEVHNAGEAAVNIVNGLHAKGVIEFDNEGKCNVIGNAHEQNEESELKWVGVDQFEWFSKLNGQILLSCLSRVLLFKSFAIQSLNQLHMSRVNPLLAGLKAINY